MQQSYQCPKCNAPVAFEMKFCGKCGTHLKRQQLRCFSHPDREAVNICSKCGQSVCSECNYVTEPDPICRNCWERRPLLIQSNTKAEEAKPIETKPEIISVKREDSAKDSSGALAEFVWKHGFSVAFRNLLLMSLAMVIIWDVLLFFLPAGWWVTAINILFFLGSIVFLGLAAWQILKIVLPNWVAIICSLLLWVFFVVLIRYLMAGILGAL